MALKITPGMLRISLTINIPPSVAVVLDQIQIQLASRALPLHILAPGDLHLTLAFLGEIRPSQIDAATQCVVSACAEIAPFELQIAGLDMAPNSRVPEVFWATIAEDSAGLPTLLTLRHYLMISLTAEQFHPDPSFIPHITLARLQANSPRIGRERVVQAMADLQNFQPILLRVSHINVQSTKLLPGGVWYQCLAQVDLPSALT